VIFTGNVDARRDDFIINCKKMVLYYQDQQTEKEQGMKNIKIDKIILIYDILFPIDCPLKPWLYN
jgi:lipopolysaccharide export system protein LptA